MTKKNSKQAKNKTCKKKGVKKLFVAQICSALLHCFFKANQLYQLFSFPWARLGFRILWFGEIIFTSICAESASNTLNHVQFSYLLLNLRKLGTVHCYNANWKNYALWKKNSLKVRNFSKCSATVHVIPSIHVFKCWQRETIGLVDGYNRINQVISLQSININNIGPPYNKHLRKMDCVSFEIWFYFWKTDACFKLLY